MNKAVFNTINRNYLLTGAVTFLLITIYAFVPAYVLPDSINRVFLERLWKLFFLPAALFLLLSGAYLIVNRNSLSKGIKKFNSIKRDDWFFALIPLIPVARYIAANQGMLSTGNSIILFVLFSLFSVVVSVHVPFFLSFLGDKHFLMAASTAFLFTVLNMAAFASAGNWSGEGVFSLQLLAFGVVWVILLLVRLLPRKLVSNIIVLLFLVNTVMAGIQGVDTVLRPVQKAEAEDFFALSNLKDREMVRNNDVIFIVYESYVPYETMLHYGYDNSRQLEYLKQNGFHLYHGVYSLGTPTTAAMTGVFNIDPAYWGGTETVSGTSAVKSVFGIHGYQTVYISTNDYIFRGITVHEVAWDSYFPPMRSEAVLLARAILMGEFSDEVSLELVGLERYITQKHNLLSKKSSSPIFMYSHSPNPGHRPSGDYDPRNNDKHIERFIERLQLANDEMRRDVEVILKNNSEAIVIIAGDHGPSLTKSGYGLHSNPVGYTPDDIDRYDIQDRFGAFLAIRWPEQEYAKVHTIEILQDVFPAIFSYLYNDDSIFEQTITEKSTKWQRDRTLGVYVKDGVIVGGRNDREPLFMLDPNESGN